MALANPSAAPLALAPELTRGMTDDEIRELQESMREDLDPLQQRIRFPSSTSVVSVGPCVSSSVPTSMHSSNDGEAPPAPPPGGHSRESLSAAAAKGSRLLVNFFPRTAGSELGGASASSSGVANPLPKAKTTAPIHVAPGDGSSLGSIARGPPPAAASTSECGSMTDDEHHLAGIVEEAKRKLSLSREIRANRNELFAASRTAEAGASSHGELPSCSASSTAQTTKTQARIATERSPQLASNPNSNSKQHAPSTLSLPAASAVAVHLFPQAGAEANGNGLWHDGAAALPVGGGGSSSSSRGGVGVGAREADSVPAVGNIKFPRAGAGLSVEAVRRIDEGRDRITHARGTGIPSRSGSRKRVEHEDAAGGAKYFSIATPNGLASPKRDWPLRGRTVSEDLVDSKQAELVAVDGSGGSSGSVLSSSGGNGGGGQQSFRSTFDSGNKELTGAGTGSAAPRKNMGSAPVERRQAAVGGTSKTKKIKSALGGGSSPAKPSRQAAMPQRGRAGGTNKGAETLGSRREGAGATPVEACLGTRSANDVERASVAVEREKLQHALRKKSNELASTWDALAGIGTDIGQLKQAQQILEEQQQTSRTQLEADAAARFETFHEKLAHLSAEVDCFRDEFFDSQTRAREVRGELEVEAERHRSGVDRRIAEVLDRVETMAAEAKAHKEEELERLRALATSSGRRLGCTAQEVKRLGAQVTGLRSEVEKRCKAVEVNMKKEMRLHAKKLCAEAMQQVGSGAVNQANSLEDAPSEDFVTPHSVAVCPKFLAGRADPVSSTTSSTTQLHPVLSSSSATDPPFDVDLLLPDLKKRLQTELRRAIPQYCEADSSVFRKRFEELQAQFADADRSLRKSFVGLSARLDQATEKQKVMMKKVKFLEDASTMQASQLSRALDAGWERIGKQMDAKLFAVLDAAQAHREENSRELDELRSEVGELRTLLAEVLGCAVGEGGRSSVRVSTDRHETDERELDFPEEKSEDDREEVVESLREGTDNHLEKQGEQQHQENAAQEGRDGENADEEDGDADEEEESENSKVSPCSVEDAREALNRVSQEFGERQDVAGARAPPASATPLDEPSAEERRAANSVGSNVAAKMRAFQTTTKPTVLRGGYQSDIRRKSQGHVQFEEN